MANRNCEGDFFRADGRMWYRCLWDGEAIDISDRSIIQGSGCTNCGRTVHAKHHGEVPVQVRRLVQALLTDDLVVTIEEGVEHQPAVGSQP